MGTVVGGVFGGFELLMIAVVFGPTIVWLVRKGIELQGRRRAVWVRTNARVADVSTIDVADGDRTHTAERFVVVFELPTGERHAADQTARLSARQKDMVLPDAVLPIRYDARDPDRFEVEWSAVRSDESLEEGAPVARGGGARRVYGPPR